MAERIVRDQYRRRVYQAEDQWSGLIDRGGPVDFFGSTIEAPVQLRFGRLDEVATYVDRVCADFGIRAPKVRHRRGGTRAHYVDGVIAIPSDRAWAMRESVVLHEIAHHVCVTREDDPRHEATFTTTMLGLVRQQLGHEGELLLRTGYSAAGAPMGDGP